MITSLKQYGYNSFMQWLLKLGYQLINNTFVSERSRMFVLTIHSES